MKEKQNGPEGCAPLKKIVLIFLMTVMAGCSQSEQPYFYGMLDVEDTYETLDEMASDSTLIVKAKLQGETEEISFSRDTFTQTPFVIEQVYKGDPNLLHSRIHVLERSMSSTARDPGNGQFLLFLKPYEGPVAEKAYVITGVYQGRFKISDEGTLQYDAEKYGGINEFQKSFVNTPVESLPDKF